MSGARASALGMASATDEARVRWCAFVADPRALSCKSVKVSDPWRAFAFCVAPQVKRLAKLHSIQLVWAGISKGVEKKLRRACGVDVVGDERFSTLDGATKWVEDY
eukprot:2431495-Pleurochrysis_carterae.AAC.1